MALTAVLLTRNIHRSVDLLKHTPVGKVGDVRWDQDGPLHSTNLSMFAAQAPVAPADAR